MWPFRKPERRQATVQSGFVDAWLAAATAGIGASPALTSAVETAAGWYSRGLSVAVPEPMTGATAALDSDCLAMVGRGFARRGESVFLIEVSRGRAMLLPVADYHILGAGVRESDWRYTVTINGPARTEVLRNVSPDRVFHPRRADPVAPWAGISPLQSARDSGKLLASIEQRLMQEVSGSPVGSIVPVPAGADAEDDERFDEARSALMGLKGGLAMPETHASGLGEGRAAAPARDWQPTRLGPNPPATMVQLREAVYRAALTAYGINPGLTEKGDGTAAREALRQLAIALKSIAATIAREAVRKLDAPPGFRLDMSGVRAWDVQGQARSVKALTDAGMPLSQATTLAGLME